MDNKIQAEPVVPQQPAPPYTAPPRQPAPPYTAPPQQSAPPYAPLQPPPYGAAPQQPAPSPGIPPQQFSQPYIAPPQSPPYGAPPPQPAPPYGAPSQQPAPPYGVPPQQSPPYGAPPSQPAAPAQPLFTPEMADTAKKAFEKAKNATGNVAGEGIGFFKKFIQTPVEALGSSSLSLPLGLTMLGINITCVTLMLDRFIRGGLFALASLTLSTNENIKADVRKTMLEQFVDTFKGAELFEGTQYAILALIFIVQAGLAILFILAAVKLGKTGYTLSYQQAIGAYAACTLPVSVAYLIGFTITTLLSYSILSTLLAFTVVFTMLLFSTLLYGKVIEPYMPDTNRRYLFLSFTNTLQYTVLLTVMGRYLAGIILPNFGSLF